MYYRDAQAIIVLFSLTNGESFENLDKWFRDIDDKTEMNNILKVVVGSKSDDDSKKEVPF